jgi:O-antigen/teichoic acid export membrane protein
VQALVAIPAGVGVTLVARDAVFVMLGEKWLNAVPFVQIIALASIATALAHSPIYMLMGLGKMRAIAGYNWSKVALILGLTVLAFPSAGPLGIAFAYLAASVGGLVTIQLLARRAVSGFTARGMLACTWRPLVCAALMAIAVSACARLTTEFQAIPRLLLSILVGSGTYALAILLTWRVAGSPGGAEAYLLEKIVAMRPWTSRGRRL